MMPDYSRQGKAMENYQSLCNLQERAGCWNPHGVTWLTLDGSVPSLLKSGQCSLWMCSSPAVTHRSSSSSSKCGMAWERGKADVAAVSGSFENREDAAQSQCFQGKLSGKAGWCIGPSASRTWVSSQRGNLNGHLYSSTLTASSGWAKAKPFWEKWSRTWFLCPRITHLIFSLRIWTFLPSRKYFLSPKLPQLTW